MTPADWRYVNTCLRSAVIYLADSYAEHKSPDKPLPLDANRRAALSQVHALSRILLEQAAQNDVDVIK